jgi:hypothetical protein
MYAAKAQSFQIGVYDMPQFETLVPLHRLHMGPAFHMSTHGMVKW